MSRISVDMLVSILKYIDIEYMTDEEGDSICELDINDEEDQEEVILKLILPGIKSEYPKSRFHVLREIIELALDKDKERKSVLGIMSFIFEDELKDQKAFLRKIYDKLLEEEKEDEIIK